MDHEGAVIGVPPQPVTNSMAGQDEHAYSLDPPQPPHSAKFNSRRDNSRRENRQERSDMTPETETSETRARIHQHVLYAVCGGLAALVWTATRGYDNLLTDWPVLMFHW